MLTRFLTLLLILVLVVGFSAQADANKYVGVKMCSMCHKADKTGNQFAIWQKSAHAGAYKTLTGEKAAAIAKTKNLKNAAEAPECLECHGAVDAKLVGTYDVKDGVQCETCHGPGSNYKTVSIMKNKDLAITNGLMLYSNLEGYCVKCHNEKSPTYVKQDVNLMWEKIKHPIPKSK